MAYFNYILWSVKYQSCKRKPIKFYTRSRNSGRFRSPHYSFTSYSQNQQQVRRVQREIRRVSAAAHPRRCGVKYTPWPKRDPVRNYFQLPNEIFLLGLSPGALAVYSYLLCCENRKTYQCWPSYNTIGRAVKMSANTVQKYVLELEDKHLIRTESTTVVTRDGRKRNGTLRYYIRPIREAVDHYHERQLCQLELDTERQKAQARLSRLCAAQEPPLPAGHPTTPPTVERGVSGLCGPVCKVGGLSDFQNGQVNRGVEKSAG